MTEAPDATLREAVLDEALNGLTSTPKTLSPWLFYDERGSQLFEAITALPEYYLTRTERAIFAEHGPSLPIRKNAPVTIAELGAGSASKTGILLQHFADHQGGLLYQPIDISPTALDEAAASISAKVPGIIVESQVANYITDGYSITRLERHRVLALYIGSSIGNFAPHEAVGILRNLRNHLEAGDTLLLGVDLAPGKHKPVETLIAAYDDDAGVTAEFNKNVLVRLNRELNANFNLDGFAHRARWNAAASRMEMHLESLAAQTVTIADERIHFEEGETIHTENSYKFTETSILALLDASGFTLERLLQDDHQRFAVALADAS
jgi:L-histidine N-alpha-methyltransferase